MTTLGWRRFAADTDAQRLRDALDVAAGLPILGLEPGGAEVGRGRHVPQSALRTDHLVGVFAADGGGHAVQITYRADAHHGQIVRVRGADVTIDTRTSREVDRPFSRAAGDRPEGSPR